MSWPMVQLDSIADKVDYGLTASAIEKLDGPRFLRITDLQDDTVDWKSVPSCECTTKQYEENKLQNGDIVFARTGATTGKSYLIKNLSMQAVFASYLIRVRPNKKVDSTYLSYFFKSPRYWSQITSMANGAAQPGVNSSKLKELEIPLPPLTEQKRIAAILDKADAIRRKRQQAIQLADEFLRAVFLDMFGDPVTNPKGWSIKYFGDLGRWSSGGTPTRSNPDLFRGDINWYSAGELNHRYLNGSVEKISEEAVRQSSAKIFPAGSMLVGMYDTAALKISILKEDSASNQACANFIPNEYVSVEWFYSYLEYARDIYLSRRRGVRQKNLNLGMIRGFELPLPPIERQKKFELFVQKNYLIQDMQNVFVTHPMLTSLSQKAFSGNL